MPDPAPLGGPAWARWTATAGGLGYGRPGPGTWGSVGAGLLAWLAILYLPPALLTTFFGVASVVIAGGGWWATRQVLADPGTKLQDPPQVVIDEVLGVSLALLLVPSAQAVASPGLTIIVAVLMFRVLDIAKPFPIDRLEALPGALGVMVDDAAAGVIAGLATATILN